MGGDGRPGASRRAPGSGRPASTSRSSRPREPAAARAGLRALVERVARRPAAGTAGSSFARDPGAAADALAGLDPERDRLVVFVGKLIASKGVELLLAAWPLVLARVPDARLVVVGFGGFREGLEQLAADLARGDLAAARATRGEHGEPLELLQAFLDGLDDAAAQAYAGRPRRCRRA